ncbi:Ent-kaurene oxidase [Escovopsis weberi]|uniref:Cytochrome P450 monooxygenase janP n=1 Tax=Escovopsis weberi TaxID=150374 RepID=JANP_ESCWE|nr:Ent-kaurene oxidase [Escovopsis weberi]DAB41647.1 TPA_exp: cytochrome P450 monooxygenase [Escovopsis weberi]
MILTAFSLQAPVILIGLLISYVVNRNRKKLSIPTMRVWPSFFPEFLDRLSYASNAARLVDEGCAKHQDKPFRLLKPDMDLIVIPLRYATELRAVTNDKLDPLVAAFDDNAGKLTNILLDSELHSDAIHRRLTPGLPKIIPQVVDELSWAWNSVIPNADDTWVPLNSYGVVLDLATRAGARVFVSDPICRDEAFLQTCAGYSRNIFNTIETFRYIGQSLYGAILGTWSPTVRKALEQLAYVQKLLGEEVHRRRAHPEEKFDDFLQWCIDLARNEHESTPEALAQRTVGILAMAVVHTTAMAANHLLFDLIANPVLCEALRKEQQEILPGGWETISQKAMLEMNLLDSLMRESQRFNPVGEFTFRRIVRKPIVLSDGYELKPGQQIGMAAKNLGMDRELLGATAETFEPTRWASEKLASGSFSHSSSSNLNFGLGRYACPGRFFASYMIKAIISRFLIEYDFKLESGETTRPANMVQGDKIFPNRDAVILFRRRKVA